MLPSMIDPTSYEDNCPSAGANAQPLGRESYIPSYITTKNSFRFMAADFLPPLFPHIGATNFPTTAARAVE